jgi:sugar phosphate isomerase/epimerase
MNADQFALFDDNLGGFARIFSRSTAVDMAAAFAETGLKQVQLNLSAVGHSTIPDSDELRSIDFAGIRSAITDAGLTVWGVSATYNMAHPDEATRAEATERTAAYIRGLGGLEATAVTLCTGTRNPENMWRTHPDNQNEESWAALLHSFQTLLPAAAEAGVLLAVEPEPGNIIASAVQAERLLTELGAGADQIGFILDPANLLSAVPRDEHPATLKHAFTSLGDRTVCVHVKDTVSWEETLAGGGVVNYDQVLTLWDALPDRVPLIIQDATEVQVPEVRERLRAAYANLVGQ